MTVSGDFTWDNHINNVALKSFGKVKRVLHEAPRNVKKLACMTLCSPVMEFACEVWDPYLVKHQTRLKNVQRHTVRFIVGRRGVESVELVVDRLKAARNSLLMKIIDGDRHSSHVGCFDSLSKGSHLHYTR